MPLQATLESGAAERPLHIERRIVARVLLADSDLASRLTLKSLLSKAGYEVDGAASTAEAIQKLDSGNYQLVLADLEEGTGLLAYARQKQYRPATARIASELSAKPEGDALIHMSNENVSNLLSRVAELINQRADRRMRYRTQ